MKIKDLTRIALFVAIISICSYITIPFAIPFTLQTLGVFLSILVLGKNKGTVAVLAYLLIGIAGIPVFSGMRGGIGILFSPTGGYLIGFLFGGYLAGFLIEKIKKKFLSCLAGLSVCYLFGSLWYSLLYAQNAVFITCVLPFIIPDILKISIAVYISKRVLH